MQKTLLCSAIAAALIGCALPTYATNLKQQVSHHASNIEQDVIKWRRHFHQNPELSNREFKTAKTIAKYLNELGLEVQTGIAKTGVVAVLDSGRPGPVVALRADIDGLPITESTALPFASKVKSTHNGKLRLVLCMLAGTIHTLPC